MASSLLVALVAAVIGAVAVVLTADPPRRHQRATRDAVVPDAHERRLHIPKPHIAKPRIPKPSRQRTPRPPRPPRVRPELDTVHSRVAAFVRLGGLLVLVGTATAATVALVLAVGVGLLQHSLR